MAADNVNLVGVKRNLYDYLKLDIEKPSLLHAYILQLAAKLAGQDKFSMLVFSRLWNLDFGARGFRALPRGGWQGIPVPGGER